jgi:hypothetical protein
MSQLIFFNNGSSGGSGITEIDLVDTTLEATVLAGVATINFGLDNLLLGSDGAEITTAQSNCGFGNGALLVLISGLRNTGIGNGALEDLESGVDNTACGYRALGSVDASNFNTAFGSVALTSLTSGTQNSAFGFASLGNLLTGGANTAFGYQALTNCTGNNNTAVGNNSGQLLLNGNNNTFLGNGAGIAYTSTESHNVCIGNTGTVGDSHKVIIGTQGSGTGQQNECFIAGIVGVTNSNAQMVTINSSTGQMGVQAIPIGNLYTITTPVSYPYTTLATDEVILVDTSAARTIVPMGSPATGQSYIIKDNVGSAATNNITITPSGKNIDGAASATINTNYGSLTIVYNGTEWSII